MNLVRDITALLEQPHTPTEKDYIPIPGPRDETLVHISSAEKCSRQIAYHLVGQQREVKTTVPAELGTFLHRYIQNHLKEKYRDLLYVEVPVNYQPYYPVIGSADIVTHDTAYDIKTVGTPSWRFIPNSSHVLQVLLYAFGLDKEYGTLLYVNRGNLRTEAHTFRVSTRVADIKRELDRFEKIFNSTELPRRLKDRSDWRCRYCPFAVTCWEGTYSR